MGVFSFIDEIAEIKQNKELTAFYTLKADEEFLKDHFKGFPVMPGVLLLETLKQAATTLLERSADAGPLNFRLVRAEDVKFGRFIKPGSRLKVFVRFLKKENDLYFLEGRIDQVSPESGKTLFASLVLGSL